MFSHFLFLQIEPVAYGSDCTRIPIHTLYITKTKYIVVEHWNGAVIKDGVQTSHHVKEKSHKNNIATVTSSIGNHCLEGSKQTSACATCWHLYNLWLWVNEAESLRICCKDELQYFMRWFSWTNRPRNRNLMNFLKIWSKSTRTKINRCNKNEVWADSICCVSTSTLIP